MPLPDDCPIPDPLELIAFLAATDCDAAIRHGRAGGSASSPTRARQAARDTGHAVRWGVAVGFGVGWMREEVESTGADVLHPGAAHDRALAALRTALRGRSGDASTESSSLPTTCGCIPDRWAGSVSTSVAMARPRPVRAGQVGDGLHPLGLDDETLAQRWDLPGARLRPTDAIPMTCELSLTDAAWDGRRSALARARRARRGPDHVLSGERRSATESRSNCGGSCRSPPEGAVSRPMAAIIPPGVTAWGFQLPIQSPVEHFVQPWEIDAAPRIGRIAAAADRAGAFYVAVCDHVGIPRPADETCRRRGTTRSRHSAGSPGSRSRCTS